MDQKISPRTTDIPDTDLIERILNGEKELFEGIIRRHNQRLYRIGISILGNAADAEEAMQEAYVKAYEHLRRFENRSSFGTWLTRIMINESMAQKKKQRLNSGNVEKLLENNTIMRVPDQILANKELSNILESAISGLPEKYRLVFVLREIEEMSVRETGATLGIEEPNVKVRLNRAKTMLKKNLDSYIKDHVYHFHLSRCDMMVKNVFARLH
ncbi:RNA polymerase sigma factor [Puia sp.]|jgi:RNA polymerase sigma-70 factor (ECF subfamily)|uniref:RNA polymerase sigma factor n=1 Tax=Puia sp. TaxID=2045100 RepID=UPI002F403F13